MKNSKEPVLKEQDELLAQTEIRQQHFRIVEKAIYENISQVLCLARIKLINLDLEDKENLAKSLEQSGNLIGKAIYDLRTLAKEVKTMMSTG